MQKRYQRNCGHNFSQTLEKGIKIKSQNKENLCSQELIVSVFIKTHLTHKLDMLSAE